MIPDVAEPLHDHALAVEAERQPKAFHFVGFIACFAQREVEAAAGGLLAPAHSALRHGLAGHAAERIERAGIERRVSVGHPRHLALTGAVIRRRHVDAGAEEILLGQLMRVAAGDALQLVEGIIFRLDPDAALRAAERDVDDGAFVGHQRRERHHLFFIHLGAVANAALHRQLVVAVLDAPRVNDFNLAAGSTKWKVKTVDAVADADLFEQSTRVFGELRRRVEVLRDLIEEVGRSAHGGIL